MTVQGEGKRWEELVSKFSKGRALGRRFRKVFFSENSPVIYLFRTPSSRIHFHFMASGDGASLSPVRHSLLHLLRSSSKPFLADRNPLISSPPPMARKKEGRFASVALRLLGCASEEASQAYAPAAASARSYSDWQRNRPRGKAKRKEERRSRDGGDVWCAPRVPFASEASVDCVVSYRRLAGSGRPDAADGTHSEVVNLSSVLLISSFLSFLLSLC